MLRNATPEIPEALNDRQADIWEPLLAIADLCGEWWASTAREAALTLAGQAEQRETIPVALLADIRAVFARSGGKRIRTEELLNHLISQADRPWATPCDGKPIHSHRLSSLLAPFEIAPRQLRFSRTLTAKGYALEDFADAFARYLPGDHIEPGK